MKGVSSIFEIKFLKEGGHTMNGQKPLTELKVSDLKEFVKITEEEIWGDLQEEAKIFLKKLLEGAMEDEVMEYIGISRKYERTEGRQSQRNGYYSRDLETELGKIERLSVPRSRDGGYRPKVFERYERKRPLVRRAIKEMFLSGISPRKVKEVLEPLIGSSPSAQTVSNVVAELDREVREYHSRRIEDNYRYLFFDGVVVKIKGVIGKRKRVILCAYGIREDGVKELIEYMVVETESESAWIKFLNNLYERGLEGKGTKLITIDGNSGLRRAVDFVYPYIEV
ncbi:MAG: transposase, partial [Candidatus Aenigmatarchaeota archaeon]